MKIDGLGSIGFVGYLVIPLGSELLNDNSVRLARFDFGWDSFVEDEFNQLKSTAGESGVCPPAESELYQSGLTEGHFCVQVSVLDGGINDLDRQADGVILLTAGVINRAVSLADGMLLPWVSGMAISVWQMPWWCCVMPWA